MENKTGRACQLVPSQSSASKNSRFYQSETENSHRHLRGFDRPSSYNPVGWLGLEHHLLAVERVDTLEFAIDVLHADGMIARKRHRGPLPRRLEADIFLLFRPN
jgi:hypothetical protein